MPFDAKRLDVVGQPVPVLEGVTSSVGNGAAQFSAAGNGTLVYLPGESVDKDSPISWMDRTGKATPLRAVSGWSNPHFSPDGRRLAVDVFDGSQLDM